MNQYFILCCLFISGVFWGFHPHPSVTAQETTTAAGDSGPKCKALFTFGYGYRQFFHMSKSSLHPPGGNLLLFMHFQVKARSDAHILLSPSPSPEDSDSVYEIVLGAGRNSFSDIRRRRRAATKTSAFTKDILSGTELKGFWVKISNEGLIQVGSEGSDLPLMYWQDPEPLDIQYFSFCTWSGVAGKWLYDCVSEESATTDAVSDAVTPELTATERLRKALLTDYDVYSRPTTTSEPLEVTVQLQVNHVQLDEKKSIMAVGSELILEWTDEKMIWDSEKWGVEVLNIVHHEIWRPELIHFNGVGKALLLRGRDGEGMRVTSDGQIRWRTSNLLQSRCQLDLRDWPWDTQTCNVQLGFWQPLYLSLLHFANGSRLELQQFRSEWEVQGLKSESVTVKKPWLTGAEVYESDDFDDNEELLPSALTFTFTLHRVNTGVYFVFIIPLIVMMLLSLTCFWMEPLSTEKLSTNCLLIVLLCGFLLCLDSCLPSSLIHTSSLFQAYSMVLLVVTCATMVTVVVSRLATPLPPFRMPPNFLCRIITSQPISCLFCLSAPKIKDGNYGKMVERTDCMSLVVEGGDMEEDPRACGDPVAEAALFWDLLVLFIDRVAFLAALIAYTVLLVK